MARLRPVTGALTCATACPLGTGHYKQAHSPLGPGQHAREGTACAGLAGHHPNESTCLSVFGDPGETQKPIVHGDVHAGVDQPHRQQRLNEIL